MIYFGALRLFIPFFFFFNRDLLGVHTIVTSYDKAPLRLPQIYDLYDKSNAYLRCDLGVVWKGKSCRFGIDTSNSR